MLNTMNPVSTKKVSFDTGLRHRFRLLAIVLLFVMGVNALAAGYSFMMAPSGKDVGLSARYLQFSPFTNFFIPGLVLFLLNGVLSIFAAISIIRKTKHYPQLIFLQGLILGGWIVIQVIMVRDFNWLHFACLLTAAAFLFLGRKLADS